VIPFWSENESDAMPLIDDQHISVQGKSIDVCVNPIIYCVPPPTCQEQPTSHACGPTVGNFSVQYEARIGLWLMTFDGGRQEECAGDPNGTLGIYLSYAKEPWGPWSTPQIIFNPVKDRGFGAFIYNPDATIDPCNPFATPPALTGGPAGPALNPNDPKACQTRGDAYGPFMIHRFNSLDQNNATLSIYYTMSTFDPYTIVLMRSDFKIGD
jgi:hypothetical protein